MKKYLSQAMRRMEKEEKKTQVDWIAPISLHRISWRKEHHFLTVFTLLVNMPCSGRGSNSWWGCQRGWGAWRRSRGGCQTPPGLQWICFALSASPQQTRKYKSHKLFLVNCSFVLQSCSKVNIAYYRYVQRWFLSNTNWSMPSIPEIRMFFRCQQCVSGADDLITWL